MGDVDISWQTLCRIVQAWSGTAVELKEFLPLHGGQINTTLELHLSNGQKAVIKASPHRVDKSYEREAYQLTLLRSFGIPVPEVYSWRMGSLDDPISHLLIEHIDGINLSQAKSQCSADEFDKLQQELAEMVATLRRSNVSDKNTCEVMDGGEMFEKLGGALQHPLERPHLGRDGEERPASAEQKDAASRFSKIHARASIDCSSTTTGPRLVHWDLWNTNVMVEPQRLQCHSENRGVARARTANMPHVEAEIAYHGIIPHRDPAFLKVYQHRHKLSAGISPLSASRFISFIR